MKGMKRNKAEESVDISGRLRQIELLETPQLASPRTPVDDDLPPLLHVQRHEGRMYVAGHEPHLRAITLLQPVHSHRHLDQADPT